MARPRQESSISSTHLNVGGRKEYHEEDEINDGEMDRELKIKDLELKLLPIPNCNPSTDVVNSSKRRFHLYQSVLIVNFTYFSCGAVLGWSSPVLVKLPHVTDAEGSAMASVMCLGSVIGPFLSGVMLDRLGRKCTVALNMLIMFASWILLALSSTDVVLLCVGRFIAGVGLGICHAAVPTYIAEISEDEVRAQLNTMYQIYSSSGQLMMYTVGPFVSFEVLHYIMVVGCGLFLSLFPFLPKSPYYLIMKDDIKQATDTLVWLRGYKSESSAQKEVNYIKETIHQNLNQDGSLSMLFSSATNRRALVICCILLWLQQFTGIIIVMFYAQKIFEMAVSTISSNTCSIVIGIFAAVTSFISPVTVKFFGYKKTLIVSLAGLAVGNVGLASYFLLKVSNFNVATISWLPLLSVVVDIISYNSGYCTIPWALSGELFPNQVKPYATTIITSSCGLVAFFTLNFFPNLVSLLGLGYLFMGCSFFCFIGIVFVTMVMQDTSGLSFQEIQLLLSGTKRKHLKLKNSNKHLPDQHNLS